MRSFWSDPYLWIHLTGIAALPVFLEICLIGFAIGDPLLPVWLELGLVAVVGIVPILWMQWQRPFYIFSLVAVTVKPEKLTDDQRRLLTLFQSQRNRVLAVLAPLALIFLLRTIYRIAPIAAPSVAFLPDAHLFGLLIAAVGFLASNLFLQVPVSVASVMLTSESTFATTPPVAIEQIRPCFTLLGLQINQIVPPIAPVATALPQSNAKTVEPTAVPLPDPAATEAADDVWDDVAPTSESPLNQELDLGAEGSSSADSVETASTAPEPESQSDSDPSSID